MKHGDGVLNKILRDELLYIVGTIKIAVYLGFRTTPFTVMLDNRTEINILYLSLAVKLGLTVIILNHKHLASTNKLKSKFISIAENTLV